MQKSKRFFILFTTLIVGMCSIIYELLISTVSSYFLGNSVKQFSIIIGFYMAFMGLGSWLSRFFKKELLFTFIVIELILGIVGAFSVPLCYLYFNYADFAGYNIFILVLVAIIGTITGLEIPLITRIIEEDSPETEGLSDVLTLDYLGALAATLLFPFILIPFMGVYKSSLIFGFINISIGVLNFIIFRKRLSPKRHKSIIYNIVAYAMIGLIGLGFIRADEFVKRWNRNLFKFPVVYEESSPYQNIILTDNDHELRMYLNGAIQFSSRDEYRYHEALVHVPAQQLEKVEDVLILGGGEGLAAREVLKYPEVQKIDLIDLDPQVTKLSKTVAAVKELNKDALSDPRVSIYHDDALKWMLENNSMYDLIIIDLPDPNSESLAKLYTVPFYNLVSNHLKPQGIFTTQATGPELSPKAFWCIDKSIRESGFDKSKPYHVNVPSFGNWGFVMSGKNVDRVENPLIKRPEIPMKFVNKELLNHIFYFPADINKYRDDVEVNMLDKPVLLEYYLEHWRELNESGKK